VAGGGVLVAELMEKRVVAHGRQRSTGSGGRVRI
jgi:hypothetical protein